MPRCIVIPSGAKRCPRKACKRSGDLYVCTEHSTMWTLLLVDDQYSAHTRAMLAFSRWETAAEGQRLIGQLYRRRAE